MTNEEITDAFFEMCKDKEPHEIVHVIETITLNFLMHIADHDKKLAIKGAEEFHKDMLFGIRNVVKETVQ